MYKVFLGIPNLFRWGQIYISSCQSFQCQFFSGNFLCPGYSCSPTGLSEPRSRNRTLVFVAVSCPSVYWLSGKCPNWDPLSYSRIRCSTDTVRHYYLPYRKKLRLFVRPNSTPVAPLLKSVPRDSEVGFLFELAERPGAFSLLLTPVTVDRVSESHIHHRNLGRDQ